MLLLYNAPCAKPDGFVHAYSKSQFIARDNVDPHRDTMMKSVGIRPCIPEVAWADRLTAYCDRAVFCCFGSAGSDFLSISLQWLQ